MVATIGAGSGRAAESAIADDAWLERSGVNSSVPGGAVVFTVAGDIGGREDPAGDVLRSMAARNADFFLLLGDISYDEIQPEASWCDWATGLFPDEHPIEVVAGNHEDGSQVNGFIRDFTSCLPDRAGAVGDYGVQYYFDVGPVRVIMVAADLSVDGVDYRYDRPGEPRDWLLARIDEAEEAGLWTIVGTHKVCVTTGRKTCEIGEAMIDDLIAHGVDLIVHGHDHNYQRSHQLRCVDIDTTTSSCIADTDSDFEADAGAVIVVSGWVGRAAYDVSTSDPEAGYFATLGAENVSGWTPGYLTVTATDTTLTGTWTSAKGGNSDTFSIRVADDPCPGPSCDTIYTVDSGGRWTLWDELNIFSAKSSFYFGNPGDIGFSGDWNCNGVATPGLYRQSDGFVYLRNSNTQGIADVTFFFGNPGDVPVAGDFNNDGCDTVSLYRPAEGRFFVINELGEDGGGLGAAETSYFFGNPGDKPFAGDFDGDGVDTFGLHRESTGLVYFRNSHTQGIADAQFIYGDPGDVLFAGDWDGDGDDTVAVYRQSNSTLYVKLTNTQGSADHTIPVGLHPQAIRSIGG